MYTLLDYGISVDAYVSMLKALEAGNGLVAIDKICRSKHHFSIHEGEMELCSRSVLYVTAHSESC